MKTLIAAALCLLASSALADGSGALFGGNSPTSVNGTAITPTTVAASTITATTAIGVSTTAPVWPLTVVSNAMTGLNVEQVSGTQIDLGTLWSQAAGGGGQFMVLSSTDSTNQSAGVNTQIISRAIGNAGTPSFLLQSASGTYTNKAIFGTANKVIGNLIYQAWTSGTSYSNIGRISVQTEGVPASASNMPAAMIFYTASTGTISASEKMRLSSAGLMTVTGSSTTQIKFFGGAPNVGANNSFANMYFGNDPWGQLSFDYFPASPSFSDYRLSLNNLLDNEQAALSFGTSVGSVNAATMTFNNGGLKITAQQVAGRAATFSSIYGSTFVVNATGSSSFGGSLSVSSSVFVGVFVATQAAGGAGASVTAICSSPTQALGTAFATGGGCVCTGAVTPTGDTNAPNRLTAGSPVTGWTCQEPGGTGGACSAYAICSRIQ